MALANLLLAISEMFAIVALMALGSIDQGRRRATTNSRSSRPEHNPLSGFGSGSSPPGSTTCSPPRSSSASRRPSWPAPTPPSSPWSRSPEGPSSQLPMVKVARRYDDLSCIPEKELGSRSLRILFPAHPFRIWESS
ncbi:hypothetical protein ACP4OV_012030 [Aristida adscensionis]